MSDGLRKKLERAVRSGDFSVVPALARLYERIGVQGTYATQVWVLLTNSRHGYGLSVHATEKGAYREAAKEIVSLLREGDVFDPEDATAIRALLKTRQWREVVDFYHSINDGSLELPDLIVLQEWINK
jgi:hypothetical protein